MFAPLPEVDLKDVGWQVQQGQAVWRPNTTAPEISGELLVATHATGDLFVQFSKSPFTIAVARKTALGWEMRFPMDDRRYSGRGAPPARLIWLLLPKAISGSTLPEPWTWEQLDAERWRLLNPRTGETLEGYFGA